ncbi:MAG: glycoside hydrolase family 125 protein, partial [Ignavibacteria bacterium]|nr:glycoside hydrolase family 125 protein [Ignavibacteria bacterium]
PSDDATIFPFLIPSNFFAAVSLKQLAVMTESIYGDSDFSQKCIALAEEVETALNDHAIVNHPKYGDILAYEIDGFENKLFMDDANIPNLLSLSYLSCLSPVDPLYLNTRKFVLSQSNPYYFEGNSANGVGSPHTLINRIWPMSIIMRAITSYDDEEITLCLRMLKNTHAGTFLMHESFDKNNPSDFTRSWFAWSNSLFGELILKIINEKPYLLRAKI